MKKREAGWQTKWKAYVEDQHKKGINFYYELKQTKTNSLAYNQFKEHQLPDLESLKSGGLVWKLSDQDQRKKPCDGFSAPPQPTYVVIKYPAGYVMIDVTDFIQEIKTSKRKSLSIARALELSYKIVKLK